MRLRFALFAALGSLACAQPGSVAGPSAGYVFDSAASAVRQVRGIAGAAVLGDPVDFGMTIVGADVSPRGDFAIATAADNSVHFFRMANGAATEIAANLGAAPTLAVFSPTGAAVALYRPDGIQVLRGLPAAPVVAFTAQVRTAFYQPATSAVRIRPMAVGAIAVSDDASLVLRVADGSINVLTASGSRKLADARGPSAIAFAPGGHDAAVVSGGTLSVYQDVAGASTRQDFPNASATAGVAFSADGTKVVMAGLRAVTVMDRATGESKVAPCDCRIGGLTRMGGLFRLNELGTEPLWLLDPAEAKLVFVPARPGA
jgi:hypothetical protein